MPRTKAVVATKQKGRQKRMGDYFSKCVTKSNTYKTEGKDSKKKPKESEIPGTSASKPQISGKNKKDEKTPVPKEKKKDTTYPEKGSVKDNNSKPEEKDSKKKSEQPGTRKNKPPVSGKNKKDKEKTPVPKEEKKYTVPVKKGNLKRKLTGAGMFGYSWTRQAQRDTEDYRNGYPGKADDPDQDLNYMFYTNTIESRPDGDYIDNIHADWWGNYKLLERHHGYIQWLFPIRERGLNWEAQELQLHEMEKISKDRRARKRVLTSYKMMLDFYGMKLVSHKDGTIARADHWDDRFYHLNRSYHNYLRITRILKCLGEFGYEHLKANFVKFVLHEGLVDGTLPNLIDSCMKYWIGVLRNDEERTSMFDYYEKLCEQIETEMSSTKSSKQEVSTGSTKGKETKTANHFDNDLSDSDDEDGTLKYAMNLINDPKDGGEGGTKRRKEHELSDDEESTDGSKVMHYWNSATGSDEVNEIETVEDKSKISVRNDEIDGNVSNELVSNADNSKAEVEVVTVESTDAKNASGCQTVDSDLECSNSDQQVDAVHFNTETDLKEGLSVEHARQQIKKDEEITKDEVTGSLTDTDSVKDEMQCDAEIENATKTKNAPETRADIVEDKKLNNYNECSEDDHNQSRQESSDDEGQKNKEIGTDNDNKTETDNSNEHETDINNKWQTGEDNTNTLKDNECADGTHKGNNNETDMKEEAETPGITMDNKTKVEEETETPDITMDNATKKEGEAETPDITMGNEIKIEEEAETPDITMDIETKIEETKKPDVTLDNETKIEEAETPDITMGNETKIEEAETPGVTMDNETKIEEEAETPDITMVNATKIEEETETPDITMGNEIKIEEEAEMPNTTMGNEIKIEEETETLDITMGNEIKIEEANTPDIAMDSSDTLAVQQYSTDNTVETDTSLSVNNTEASANQELAESDLGEEETPRDNCTEAMDTT